MASTFRGSRLRYTLPCAAAEQPRTDSEMSGEIDRLRRPQCESFEVVQTDTSTTHIVPTCGLDAVDTDR
jgi:hypothetical protein